MGLKRWFTRALRGTDVRLLIASAVIAGFLLVWCPSIPLGIPSEWTWPRRPIADDFWFSLIPALASGATAGLLVWFGCGRIENCSRWERSGWLGGLFLASFGLLSGLREAAPPEFRSAKVAWVLYYQGSSGYFTEARKIRDTREFLSHYERELQKGDVLHQGTHPPGLIVGYRGLMWICERSEWLRQFLLATQPEDLREAFRIIGRATRLSVTPLTELDRCVLWLAALVMQVCAAATVIPLYGLLRLHCRRVTSWQLASIWPLVPAVTVFSPKSDTCFPFLGCLVLALWLHGLKGSNKTTPQGLPRWLTGLCTRLGFQSLVQRPINHPRRGGWGLLESFMAGFVFWLGMTLSLAMLPVACLAALLTGWYLWTCLPAERIPNGARKFAWGLVAAGIGFAPITSAVRLWTHCNLMDVWSLNYSNHAGFYARFPRTYWAWLLVNPVELSLAVGLPLMVLALSSWRHNWKNLRSAASGPYWMSLLTWSLLWLSGKNMGEAARLWIFLMPWIIWSAGSSWDAAIVESELGFNSARRRWLLCWVCQFLAALTIITRVVGFHTQGL